MLKIFKYIIIFTIALSTVVYASRFGNLLLSGNSISATDTNGDVELLPSGTGSVKLENSSTVGYVWTATDTAGRGSWQVAAGGIAWSDPVDASIVPDTDDTYNLGSSTNKFADVFSNEADLGTSTGGLFNTSWGTEIPGVILDGTTTDAGTAGAVGMVLKANASQAEMILLTADQSGANSSSRIDIYTGYATGTGSSGTIDMFTGGNTGASGSSGVINLTTGDSTNGNSGNINLETGTAGGTRGTIQFQDGSQGTSNECWISTNTSGSGNWAPCPSSGVGLLNITNQTSAYTATSGDDYIGASGGTFTITLPAAGSNTGKIFDIKKTDASLSNIITIDPNGAELIGGVSTKTLNTLNESYRIVSDGSNWIVLEHKTKTPITDAGAITFSCVGGGSPTKGTVVTDRVLWHRDGQYLIAYYEYDQSTGGVACANQYLIDIPNSGTLAIDTSLVTLETAVVSASARRSRIGTFNGAAGGSWTHDPSHATPYNSTQFRLIGFIGGATVVYGNTIGGFQNAPHFLSGTIKVPISGWDE
jgi:hypothetical protein